MTQEVWVSPEDKAVLKEHEATPVGLDELVVPCSEGRVTVTVGDEFTEKLSSATCTFRVGGFTLDRRCLVRMIHLKGELTREQQEDYLHVKEVGDLTVWAADSVAARVVGTK